ncbi:molybdopterin-binding oxidoreductase [bacterium]|nr:MAG: molybdopterin-binding oxidoreductase [bacterium]
MNEPENTPQSEERANSAPTEFESTEVEKYGIAKIEATATEDAVPATPRVLTDEDVEAQMRRMSRRSFLWAGTAVLGTVGAFRWINTRRTEDGLVWPLRRSLDTSGEVARDLFSETRLAPQWDAKRAREPRVNGDIGMGEDFDPSTWKLQVSGLVGEDIELGLNAIKALPHTQFTTELKCIEGWSTIVSWGGVRLSDFLKRYPPQTQSGDTASLKKPDDLPGYVGLSTPDGAYYVGLDREAALHPQTLLCTHMNGKPLTVEHGAPLRLVVPVKYGVKHIKRIGSLVWSNERPADYWAEQGYDWYGGH